jgi:nucleoid DNA-binding protein
MDRYAVLSRELEVVMAKKVTNLDKAMGKSAILTELAASTELSKKDVGRVLDALGVLIERHIGKRSVGTFTLPGLLKVKVVQTPARPAERASEPVSAWGNDGRCGQACPSQSESPGAQ